MSLVTLKNEFNEDLLACRACLATNRKLYSLHQDEVLKAYKNVTGQDVSPYDTLPQYICNYCTVLLLKYNTFRDQCHRATIYLEDARIRNKNITTEYLNYFQPYMQHKTSEIKQISISEHNITTESLSNFKSDDTDDHFDNYDDQCTYSSPINENIKIFTETDNEKNDPNAYSSTNAENLKIYAETVKIKIENDLPVTPEKPQKNVHKRKKTTARRKNSTKKSDTLKQKGKFFETKENMSEFEKAFDVEISVLSEDQQMKDVLDRKSSLNYLHSPYKCELCFKGYMGADILDKHVLSQHDPSRGNVVCEFCQFRYKDRRGLNQHLKSHRLKFSCKQCSYISRTTFNAKEHFKMHGGQMHECRHCGKSYEKLSSHLSHLRIHHPSEFIWCDVCGEAFIGSFGLNAHKKRAHRHLPLLSACPSCNKHFIDNSALQRHSSLGRCTEHTCLHCGEPFDEALQLRDHLLEIHRSFKVYSCEKCDKTFTRESLYSAHYRRIHVDCKDKANRKKDRPWVCEVCGKTLPNKCVLLYHQRNHTGEKPYQCTQCPKSFTMRKLLQSHLRVHTSARPYTCKLCPKAFKGLSALRTHEHIHSGGQPKTLKNRIIQ